MIQNYKKERRICSHIFFNVRSWYTFILLVYFFIQIFVNMDLPPVSFMYYTLLMVILHGTVLHIRKSSSQYMPSHLELMLWIKISLSISSLSFPLLSVLSIFPSSPWNWCDPAPINWDPANKIKKNQWDLVAAKSKPSTFKWLIRPQDHGALLLSSIYL